jgi:DNA-directed RNA polymerase specialized sigma24 family protein
MSDSHDHSITRWVQALKAGDPAAAAFLFEYYRDRLLKLARARLRGAVHRAVGDEEDAVLAAFFCLYQGIKAGRFDRFHDREGLWRLLAAITGRKVLEQWQKYHRQKRWVDPDAPHPVSIGNGYSAVFSLEDLSDDAPDERLDLDANEETEKYIQALPDPILRQIARWRLEGLEHAEIAKRLGCCIRTIERKVDLIRLCWLESGLLEP